MVLSAILLATLGVAVCTVAARVSLNVLGLGVMQTLLWLGLAEVPAPPVSRRRVRSA